MGVWQMLQIPLVTRICSPNMTSMQSAICASSPTPVCMHSDIRHDCDHTVITVRDCRMFWVDTYLYVCDRFPRNFTSEIWCQIRYRYQRRCWKMGLVTLHYYLISVFFSNKPYFLHYCGCQCSWWSKVTKQHNPLKSSGSLTESTLP